MKASYSKLNLKFKAPSGTSRGVLTKKTSWFLRLEDNGKVGIGECSTIAGLSPDLKFDLDRLFTNLVETINAVGVFELSSHDLASKPAVRFCIETALNGLECESPFKLFDPNDLSQPGIPINGLIWMGEIDFMKRQIREKIEEGYSCIKIKIAALDFEDECHLLKHIRKEFSENDLILRVDANGGFSSEGALEKLKRLSDFNLHSIEQPIKPNQLSQMADLCQLTPIPIALDEELIGIEATDKKRSLLDRVKPQFLIIKPSLIGGCEGSQDWIELADERGCGWWVTSALESNIGLNVIAQWTSTLGNSGHQGLGTGKLFTNNIPSPLTIKEGKLYSMDDRDWDMTKFPQWLS